MSVRDTDRGASYLLKRAAQLANRTSFGVGVPENAGTYPDGTPVATVAAAHEFGLGNVPQRSFIRSWYDGKGEGFWGNELARMAQQSLMQGTDLHALIAEFGERSVQEIRARMDAGIPPELQDETVARKRAAGSTTPETPLENTHQLREAITYEVKK